MQFSMPIHCVERSKHRSPAASYSCFLGFVCLLALFGCASLPTEKEFTRRPGKENRFTVANSLGELPIDASRAIVQEAIQKSPHAEFLQRQISLVESIGGSPLLTGNKIAVLKEGEAVYMAMFHAIDAATDHINLEAYLIDADEIGRSLSELLLKKRAQGVEVNIIYDSYGCRDTPKGFFKRLQNAGVRTLEFNPVNPFKSRKGWSLNHRDHRKVLIVDGKVAFTGSVNITGLNCKSSISRSFLKRHRNRCKDLHLLINGPVVAEFQKLFLEAWKRANGPELTKANYFPVLAEEGESLIQVVSSKPGRMNRLTYMMYYSAVMNATRFIHLTSPYFVMDKQMLEALCKAATRGVDVQIIVPKKCDSRLARHAGRHRFDRLLHAGVKLFERRGAMLHSKTGVIDGVWSTVGSTNLDMRSFLINDEVNAVIIGEDFASQMETIFAQELRGSDLVQLDLWQTRSSGRRIREWLANLLSYWL